MIKHTIKLSLSLTVFLFLGPAYAASFDCQKAASAIEKLICANPKLSQLDSDLLDSYRKARVVNPSIVEEQRSWIKGNMACTDADCLEKRYIARISQLNSMSAAAPSEAVKPVAASNQGVPLERLFATGGYWVFPERAPNNESSCQALLQSSPQLISYQSFRPTETYNIVAARDFRSSDSKFTIPIKVEVIKNSPVLVAKVTELRPDGKVVITYGINPEENRLYLLEKSCINCDARLQGIIKSFKPFYLHWCQGAVN
jgi:hypothetical protein